MLPEDRIRLQYIIDEAEEVCRFAGSMGFEDYIGDRRNMGHDLPGLIVSIRGVLGQHD